MFNLSFQRSVATEIMSALTVYLKYSKQLKGENRRETWNETIERNKMLYTRKFPHLKSEIDSVYELVESRKILPSMRSLQFAFRPIEQDNSRIYNCAFLPMDNVRAFSEIMYLLLGGTGIGFKILPEDVSRLPKIKRGFYLEEVFCIEDSREGWSDAILSLINFHFGEKFKPIFDFGKIREEGSEVSSGGKAAGPMPLKKCLYKIGSILNGKVDGECLKPIEVHDIVCHIADAVVCGGIRRAALISLFSKNDKEMICSKTGEWWKENPQRARANNSAFLERGLVDREAFFEIWKTIESSGCGEPGIYWTNDVRQGTNPCCEIALQPNQFCNLCEVNVSNVSDQEDLNNRVKSAAFLGTLQASFTDFKYLRPIWRETTENEALIGVGLTGIASNAVASLNLNLAAKIVVDENKRVAKLIKINSAARCTTIKPSGTASLVMGCSSGIHAYHNDYYIRRVRINKSEKIYGALLKNNPSMVEDDVFNQAGAIICVPQEAPKGSIIRTEKALDLLERIKHFHYNWIKPGHNSGANTHNISATISIKPTEWNVVGNWLWENRENYNGLSVLPYDNGTYVQAPFTDCTKEEFEEQIQKLETVDLRKVEETNETNFLGESACDGAKCEVPTSERQKSVLVEKK